MFWKRLPRARWTQTFLQQPDENVRNVTGAAFASDLTDIERLDALRVLPGFHVRGPVASTLLSAWNPVDFAVMDRRARAALRTFGLDEIARGLPSYLTVVRAIRDQLNADAGGRRYTARSIDKGLFKLA